MLRTLLQAIFFTICIGQFCFSLPTDQINVDSHLAHFSEYNNSVKHDNIDDTPLESHSHSHKHSEEGEEHDHEHEHSKSLSAETKLTQKNYNEIQFLAELEIEDFFFSRVFISDSFPLGLFRPPIV